MELYKLLLITIVLLLSGSWITLTSTWYISNVYYIDSWTGSDLFDIEQRAGFNFIIKEISVTPDCIFTWCIVDISINDSTASGNILKFIYKNINELKTTNNILDNELIITNTINIYNQWLDWYYINVIGYYNPDDDRYSKRLIYELFSNDIDHVIWLIIIYFLWIYFLYFFSKNWFKIWKDYILKKEKND